MEWKNLFSSRRARAISGATFTLLLAAVSTTYYFATQPEIVPVTWTKIEESPVVEPVVADANKKGRFPAAAGPVFENEDGQVKLRIELKFICSAWMFLRDARTIDPTAINEDLCAKFAQTQTEAANLAFRNSKIPVKFNAVWQVEPQRYTRLGRTVYSAAGMAERLSQQIYDRPFIDDAVNQNDRLSIPDLMPAVVISDTRSVMNYVPYSEKLSGKYTKLPSRTSSKVVPGDNRLVCNPNLLKRVNNFEAAWGVSPSYIYTGVITTETGAKAGICSGHGTCPANYIPQTGANGKYCLLDCACLHLLGIRVTQETFDKGGCGTYPGPPLDPSGVTCNGQIIEGSPERWEPPADYAFRIRNAGLYSVSPMQSVLEWANKNKNYLAPTGDYKIVIFVRPYGERMGGGTLYGAAAAVSDPSSGYMLTAKDPGYPQIVPLPAASQFLPTVGFVVVADGSGDSLLTAHEIGHVLGGFHEADTMVAGSPLTGPELQKRKVGAFYNHLEFYGTVMTAKTSTSVPYFSSRSISAPKIITSGVEDNRANIVKTISYLAGRDLETVAPPERTILEIIKSLIFDE